MSKPTLSQADKLIKLRDVELMFEEFFDPGSMPSRSTIVGWIEDGTLEGVQIGAGRNYYVRRSSIDKLFGAIGADSFQRAV